MCHWENLFIDSQQTKVASWVALVLKNAPASAGDVETWARSLGWEDPLEKEVATQFRILAWEMP